MTNAIQVSSKIGDAIFVIGGNTPEEFATNARLLLGADGFEDIKGMFKMCLVGGTEPAVVERAAAAVNAGFNSTPAPSPAAPAGGPSGEETDKWGNRWVYGIPAAPVCPHGPRVQKNGTSKAGKPYSGWACFTHSPRAYSQRVNKDASCEMEF